MSTERCEHGVIVSTTVIGDEDRCYQCQPLEHQELKDLIDERAREIVDKAVADLVRELRRGNPDFGLP